MSLSQSLQFWILWHQFAGWVVWLRFCRMSFMLSETKHLQVFVFFMEACFKEHFIWMWWHNTSQNLDSWWIVWLYDKYLSVLFQRSESVSGSSLANLCLISRIKINRGFISSYYLISCRMLQCNSSSSCSLHSGWMSVLKREIKFLTNARLYRKTFLNVGY